MNIEEGDYVEPNFEDFSKVDSHDDINYEDLYGFVTSKEAEMITIKSIGRNVSSTWNEKHFKKADVPEIFKETNFVRVKK